MWDSPDEPSQCDGAPSPPPPEEKKEANPNGDVKPKPNLPNYTPWVPDWFSLIFLPQTLTKLVQITY